VGREFNHSSSYNPEVTNEWSYTPHPNIPSRHGQGNLTFFNCHLHDDRKTLQNMEAHKRHFLTGGLNPNLSAITDTCLSYKQKSTWKKVTKSGRK